MDAKSALKLATETKDYWSKIYKAMKDDIRFSIGLDHYPGKTQEQCLKEGLMTVPVLPQFIHQVVNDMRMNTPSINVLPGEDDQSDIETAKIFKGLIKNIEYKSKADEVYDTAGEYAVRGGLGFAYVDHDYISEDSFLQELKLRRCHNPGATYLDPSYTECDGSDAEYGFILEPIKKKQFEKRWPGKKFVSFDDAPGDDNLEEINICQFFIKKYTEVTKQMAADGKMVDYQEEDEAAEVKKTTRKLRKVTIERYYYSGDDILEQTTFPGIYIPIIPFHGEEVWDDGKRHLLSLFRQAKDAQRRVNKWASKESELLDMSPIAPILAPYGAVEDFGDEYSKVGDVNVIRYRQYSADGSPLNKPERLNPPQIPTGFVNAMQEASEHVKQAMGMYNASIGARSNETSGVAIDARKVEGEVATFHFGDNRNRSIQHIGRILVCAIPEIYDTDRIIQIIGDEEEPRMVGINGAAMQDGQKQEYDLRKGKYDVRVTTGASFTTKRQEAATLLGDVITKTPQLMGVMGDLWAKNLDVPGADALAARIKKTIPKELIADEEAEKNGEQPVDPEKEEMARIIEALQMQLTQVEQELQSKQGEESGKLADLQIKSEELEMKRVDQQIKAQSEVAKAELDRMKLQLEAEKLEIERIRLELEIANAGKEPEKPKEPSQPIGIKLDTTGFQMMKTPEAEQEELLAKEAEQQRIADEKAKELEEMQFKAAQTEAVIEALASISQQLGQLTSQVSQPITVVRNEAGAIIGAQ